MGHKLKTVFHRKGYKTVPVITGEMPTADETEANAQWSKSWQYYRNTKSRASRHRCFYCGVPMVTQPVGAANFLTKDHVIPRRAYGGGQYERGNQVLACAWCNSNKGHKTVEEFRTLFAQWSGSEKFHGEVEFGLDIQAIMELRP